MRNSATLIRHSGLAFAVGMVLSETLAFFAATDVGRKRGHNEDNFLVDKDLGLFIVADGMGGHAAGEVASAMAVRVVHEVLTKQRDLLSARAEQGPRSEVSVKQILGLLEYAVQTASAKIHAKAQEDKRMRGMGTTMSLLLIIDSYGYVAHVGDSRIYLARMGTIHQVTEDHTVANELLRLGMVSPDRLDKVPRRNAITRAVGVYQHVDVDTLTLEVLPNDQFLLASDGLTGYFDETGVDMGPFFQPEDGDGAVAELIAFANEHGGKDNITTVLVRLGSGDGDDTQRARRLALKREVLMSMPLFSRLNERELLRVLQVAEVYQYEAGEVVVRQGERGDRMFLTLDGHLKVEREGTVLGELGPGDHLGEMSLIRSLPRSATVTAMRPTELISLKRDDFFEMIRTEPHIAVKLLWQFLNVIADRLDQTSRDLSSARNQLDAEDITDLVASDSLEPEMDPFSGPVGALGSMRLGFGGPILGEQSPPPAAAEPKFAIADPPSFDDAPQMAHRIADSPAVDTTGPELYAIEDSPSFDDAPDFAQRIDDSPSFDDAPALAQRIDDGPDTPQLSESNDDSVDGDTFPEPSTERTYDGPAPDPDAAVPAAPDEASAFDNKKTTAFDSKKTRRKRRRKDRLRKTVRVDTGDVDAAAKKVEVGVVESDPGSAEPPPADDKDEDEVCSKKSTLRRAQKITARSGDLNSARDQAVRTPGSTLRGGFKKERSKKELPEEEPPNQELPKVASGPAPVIEDLKKTSTFRPTKVTMPLDPPASLRSELDELRKQFKERLKKARKDRKERNAKDSD